MTDAKHLPDLAQSPAEPAAWQVLAENGSWLQIPDCLLADYRQEGKTVRPLFAAQPPTAPVETDDLVTRLDAHLKSDHQRGCDGRCYSCSCGFDAATEKLLEEALNTIGAQAMRLEACDAEIARMQASRSSAETSGDAAELLKLAYKIAAFSPSKSGPIALIARERRMIEDALRHSAGATNAQSGALPQGVGK